MCKMEIFQNFLVGMFFSIIVACGRNGYSQSIVTVYVHNFEKKCTQGNYATVGSAVVAIAIVGRGGWAGLSSTVAI